TSKQAVKDARQALSRASAASPPLKAWRWVLGQPKFVAASVDGKLEAKAGAEGLSVLGEGNAGGYVAKRKFNALGVQASAGVPPDGDSSVSVRVSVLGQTVFNQSPRVKAGWKLERELGQPFDQRAKIPFAIGPVPCSLTIGAKGRVGVKLFLGVGPLKAT